MSTSSDTSNQVVTAWEEAVIQRDQAGRRLCANIEKFRAAVEAGDADVITTLHSTVTRQERQFKAAHSKCLKLDAHGSSMDAVRPRLQEIEAAFEGFAALYADWCDEPTQHGTTGSDDAAASPPDRRDDLPPTGNPRNGTSADDARLYQHEIRMEQLARQLHGSAPQMTSHDVALATRLLEQTRELVKIPQVSEDLVNNLLKEVDQLTLCARADAAHRDYTAPPARGAPFRPPYMTPSQGGSTPHPLWGQQHASVASHSNFSVLDSYDRAMGGPERTGVPLFAGGAQEYLRFRGLFHNRIAPHLRTDEERFNQLLRHLTGTAYDVVATCMLAPDSSDAYREACELLDREYGQRHELIRHAVQKLTAGPPIDGKDSEALRRFYYDLLQAESTVRHIDGTQLSNYDMLLKIARRIPTYKQREWMKNEYEIAKRRPATLSDFRDFVYEWRNMASRQLSQDLQTLQKHTHDARPHKKPYKATARAAATSSTTAPQKTASQQDGQKQHSSAPRKCSVCSGSCRLFVKCKAFHEMSVDDRRAVLRTQGVCNNCFRSGHTAKDCDSEKRCGHCGGKHHGMLHSEKSSQAPSKTPAQGAVNQEETAKPHVSSAAGHASTSATAVFHGVVPVIARSGERVVHTYALIDNGSDKTFCTSWLASKLQAPGRPVEYHLSTLTGKRVLHSGYDCQFRVKGASDEREIQLKSVWTVDQLPVTTSSAATVCDVKRWPHLAGIHLPTAVAGPVNMLIGTDVPVAHAPIDYRVGNESEPYAVKTTLGWAVRGPASPEQVPHVHSNWVRVEQQARVGMVPDTTLDGKLEEMWSTDFVEIIDRGKPTSVQDNRALEQVKKSMQVVNGHYQAALPWREPDKIHPSSLPMARKRASHLRKRLSNDNDLHQMYTAAMQKYIDAGHAEPVNMSTMVRRCWYLPHQPVVHPMKPGKVRVVFDAAAPYAGVSLNDQLLKGPDMANSLVGVLMRFRQHQVALSADIEAMFCQIKVPPDDRDAFRFLWWRDGDLTTEPKHYRMTTHVFGATSSPFIASFALQQAAEDADEVSAHARETVKEQFYVDDLLTSGRDVDSVCKLRREVTSVLAKRGFRLTKFVSTHREVLEDVPEQDRAPGVVDLEAEKLPTERALGVYWNVEEDAFLFKVKHLDDVSTKRGILSAIASLYDPLGLAVPVTLKPKMMLQECHRLQLHWDDRIPDDIQQAWTDWRRQLFQLESFRIRRTYSSGSEADVDRRELHTFTDASERGYGAAVYLRTVYKHAPPEVSLVIGKARVTPIKTPSIPRLELVAALTGARIADLATRELGQLIPRKVFWTDSTIVLGYIRAEEKRFKTFVRNRVDEIRQRTGVTAWRHVRSTQNPADHASRGIDAGDQTTLKVWIDGPQFLRDREDAWPDDPTVHLPPEAELDEKTGAASLAVVLAGDRHGGQCDVLSTLIQHYSSWHKLLRITAWLRRVLKWLQSPVPRKPINDVKVISLDERRQARDTLVAHVQGQHFTDDIKRLRSSATVGKHSALRKLNPQMKDELLVVCGRATPHIARGPQLILPKNDPLTDLIISTTHRDDAHSGKQQTLLTVRHEFWVIDGMSAVRRVLSRCITCKKLDPKPLQPMMAPLRPEQAATGGPPFQATGVDYCGPVETKFSRRGRVKRWICLFTCLATRAVHLEVAYSLTTDGFLGAYSRFTARRGRPAKLFSDNGTNFIGAERELREQIAAWNVEQIEEALKQQHTEWFFNPPTASHMGGAWERMIRSTRRILRALGAERLLTDEQLHTFVIECERILNDRPLTAVSDDVRDCAALTPSMLLGSHGIVQLPLGTSMGSGDFLRRWWRAVQAMTSTFWRRWRREYLQALQTRPKWCTSARDLQEDDLVLCLDKQCPRGRWPLARVIEAYKSSDGHVRAARVRTADGRTHDRPATGLALLEAAI